MGNTPSPTNNIKDIYDDKTNTAFSCAEKFLMQPA
jgi:hypothetical protein